MINAFRDRKASLALVAAACIGAIVLAATQFAEAGEEDRAVAEVSETQPGGQRPTARFGILRQGSTTGAQLPTSVSRAWAEAVSAAPDERVALGRMVTSAGRSVAVVGNERGVCLVEESSNGFGGSTCATPAEALEGRALLVTVCEPGLTDGRLRVVGLLPDGVDQVEFQGGPGSRVVAPVVQNVYEVELPAYDVVLRTEWAVVHLPLESMALRPGERCFSG